VLEQHGEIRELDVRRIPDRRRVENLFGRFEGDHEQPIDWEQEQKRHSYGHGIASNQPPGAPSRSAPCRRIRLHRSISMRRSAATTMSESKTMTRKAMAPV